MKRFEITFETSQVPSLLDENDETYFNGKSILIPSDRRIDLVSIRNWISREMKEFAANCPGSGRGLCVHVKSIANPFT